jgi:hypothetical protein
MTEQRKRRPAAPPVGRQIKDLEDRLAHLEAMLADVRAEAGRSSGAARARLERVAEAVAERTAQARETLSVTLDRVSRALLSSRERIEREVGLLTRGLRAGVRAGRDAYRAKPRK